MLIFLLVILAPVLTIEASNFNIVLLLVEEILRYLSLLKDNVLSLIAAVVSIYKSLYSIYVEVISIPIHCLYFHHFLNLRYFLF